MKLCLTINQDHALVETMLDNIEEYVAGFEYFYIRFTEARTASYLRSNILNIDRIYPDGTRKRVHLKHVPADRRRENE